MDLENKFVTVANNTQRYLDVITSKKDAFKQAFKENWLFISLTFVIVALSSYYFSMVFGTTLNMVLGVISLITWIWFMYQFRVNMTVNNAKLVIVSSISVVMFIIQTLVPMVQSLDVELPIPYAKMAAKANVDSSTTTVPTTHSTHSTHTQKVTKVTVKLSADGRADGVDANPNANEGKYEPELMKIDGGYIKKPTKATGTAVTASALEKKDALVWAYVERFYAIAKAEQVKFKIPTSIKLAQGLLESNAGQSYLSRYNNHFGIKTFDKRVPHVIAKDDTPLDKFKKYSSAWESYRDHSQFLSRSNYKHLFLLSQTDYKGWARGLEKAGYATDQDYAENLIRLIERYQLNKYDL